MARHLEARRGRERGGTLQRLGGARGGWGSNGDFVRKMEFTTESSSGSWLF